MTRTTTPAQRRAPSPRRGIRRLLLLVLAAELVVTLGLRLTFGAPPASATRTATAVAPLEVPAPPALVVPCAVPHAPGEPIQVCHRD
ncbi:MAG: hypothetical protein EP329_13250 [Deltaproteobacteria bacterium]|nr:MAG: hypothetical protein EP329_13250 [Deltaproteobacteria bacterium]